MIDHAAEMTGMKGMCPYPTFSGANPDEYASAQNDAIRCMPSVRVPEGFVASRICTVKMFLVGHATHKNQERVTCIAPEIQDV